MTKELRFTPKLFSFLRELKDNNDREWFEANRQRYLDDLRDPFQAFIAAINPRLSAINSSIVADPKRSLFRIYRDTRFSKSKVPYKTAASAFFFFQQAGQKSGKEGPGIYLHLEPEKCFLGAGLYHPDPVTRKKITEAIANKTDAWRDAVSGKEFRRLCRREGESMARLPKPYDPQHEFADDLKRKDFVVISTFSEQQVCAKDFIDRVDHICQTAAPYLGFIVKAVGLKW